MTGLILSDGERGDEDGQLFESGELMEPACVKRRNSVRTHCGS